MNIKINLYILSLMIISSIILGVLYWEKMGFLGLLIVSILYPIGIIIGVGKK